MLAVEPAIIRREDQVGVGEPARRFQCFDDRPDRLIDRLE
jgi:hypothetical protein